MKNIAKKDLQSIFMDIFNTHYGALRVAYCEEPDFKIVRIHFPMDSREYIECYRYKTMKPSDKQIIENYFLNEQYESIPDELLDFSLMNDIEFKTLTILKQKVPRGFVISYSKLASFVSSKNTCRLIGHILGENPFPLVIPCHRVIKKTGEVGSYMQSDTAGRDFKIMLLKKEEIEVNSFGIVSDEYFIK